MAAPSTPATWRAGAKVRVDDPKWPGLWTVAKVNPTTCLLASDDSGMLLKCPKHMLLDPSSAPVTDDVRIPWLAATVVRYTGTNPKVARALYVVMADRGEPLVRVTQLGADGGRYWKLKARDLTPVPAGDIVAAYVAAGGAI